MYPRAWAILENDGLSFRAQGTPSLAVCTKLRRRLKGWCEANQAAVSHASTVLGIHEFDTSAAANGAAHYSCVYLHAARWPGRYFSIYY